MTEAAKVVVPEAAVEAHRREMRKGPRRDRHRRALEKAAPAIRAAARVGYVTVETMNERVELLRRENVLLRGGVARRRASNREVEEAERARIGQEFARRIRDAQETAEGHIARGDREAIQLSRERGRVYRLALEVVDPDHKLVAPLATLCQGSPDA